MTRSRRPVPRPSPAALGAALLALGLALGGAWWLLRDEAPTADAPVVPAPTTVDTTPDEDALPDGLAEAADPQPLEVPEGAAVDEPVAPPLVLGGPWFAVPQEPEPDTAVTVRLADEARQVVVDGRVELWSDRRALDEPGVPPLDTTLSDGAGLAHVIGPRGALLFAWAEGVGSAGPLRVRDLDELAGPDGVPLLTLAPAGRLTGVVLDADERPTAGVELVFARRGAAGRLPRGVRTDGEGRFDVPVDAPASLAVIGVDGERTTHPGRAEVAPGVTAELRLRFPGRWRVEGVLLDDEQPVAGGNVTLWRRFPGYDVEHGVLPPEPAHRAETRTDEEGRFTFDLPRAGDYSVLGRSESRAPGPPVEVSVDDGRPVAQVVLAVLPPASIRGRLGDGTGAPLPGVTVRARPAHLFLPEEQAYAPTVWARFGEAEADTDEQGRFELGPLHPDGRYIVFCRPEPERPDRKLVLKDVVPRQTELVLVASDDALRRATLSGRVFEEAGGAAVLEYRTTLLIRLDGRVIDTEQQPLVDEEGGFLFEGLAPGYEYRLRVDGLAPGLGVAAPPWFVADGRGTHLDVRLPGAGRLEVTVVDSRGEPLERATVHARRQSDDFAVDPSHRRVSDAVGRCTWDGLPPGTYRVSAEVDGREANLEAEVTTGLDSRHELRVGG